jgi:hypothetical protein
MFDSLQDALGKWPVCEVYVFTIDQFREFFMVAISNDD